MDDPIYLDHNATTPVLPAVVEAMLPYLGRHFGNPSSAHVYGQRARSAVDRARRQVGSFLGCSAAEIYFTSGGTEANNLAILGATAAGERRQVVTSVVEHPATVKPCDYLEEQGFEVVRLPVDAAGRVELDRAAAAIGPETALVSVMHANNEVGTVEPIAELAALAADHGALVHTDAAQSAGKIPVDIDRLGVDLLSIAGHKLHAPKGIGALYIGQGAAVEPVLLGSDHESGIRPGTENVASIVALGQACEISEATGAQAASRMEALRDALWTKLHAAIPDARINGAAAKRLPNTLNMRFPGVMGPAVLEAAPQVAASTGSACHSDNPNASSVLVAMGVPADQALGSVRLSLGRETTADDVDRAAAALIAAYRSLKSG